MEEFAHVVMVLLSLIAAGLSENDIFFGVCGLTFCFCSAFQLEPLHVLTKESPHCTGMIHSLITNFKSYFPPHFSILTFLCTR